MQCSCSTKLHSVIEVRFVGLSAHHVLNVYS